LNVAGKVRQNRQDTALPLECVDFFRNKCGVDVPDASPSSVGNTFVQCCLDGGHHKNTCRSLVTEVLEQHAEMIHPMCMEFQSLYQAHEEWERAKLQTEEGLQLRGMHEGTSMTGNRVDDVLNRKGWEGSPSPSPPPPPADCSANAPNLIGGNDGCCTVSNQCDAYEGDCDSDADCNGSLKCGTNNCPWRNDDATDDCCGTGCTASSQCNTNAGCYHGVCTPCLMSCDMGLVAECMGTGAAQSSCQALAVSLGVDWAMFLACDSSVNSLLQKENRSACDGLCCSLAQSQSQCSDPLPVSGGCTWSGGACIPPAASLVSTDETLVRKSADC